MTEKRKSIKQKIEEIKKDFAKYGAEIYVNEYKLIDEDHLDCTWYGANIATVKFNNGYGVVIDAAGDIVLSGFINGEEIYEKDKSNSGKMYYEIAAPYGVDDAMLETLLNSKDEKNYLVFDNNNWIEANVITPEGNLIDMSYCDNILENNVLDALSGAEYYVDLVNTAIKNNL